MENNSDGGEDSGDEDDNDEGDEDEEDEGEEDENDDGGRLSTRLPRHRRPKLANNIPRNVPNNRHHNNGNTNSECDEMGNNMDDLDDDATSSMMDDEDDVVRAPPNHGKWATMSPFFARQNSNTYFGAEKIILLKITERDVVSGCPPPNGIVQFTLTQLKCLIEAMLQINNLRKGWLLY